MDPKHMAHHLALELSRWAPTFPLAVHLRGCLRRRVSADHYHRHHHQERDEPYPLALVHLLVHFLLGFNRDTAEERDYLWYAQKIILNHMIGECAFRNKTAVPYMIQEVSVNRNISSLRHPIAVQACVDRGVHVKIIG